MKEVFQRFNIPVDLKGAQTIFRNRIDNLLFSSPYFQSGNFDIEELELPFCNRAGLRSQSRHSIESYFKETTFSEYLAYVQIMLDILYNSKDLKQSQQLELGLRIAINESPVDLGISVRKSNNKAMIVTSGSKFLDDKLVDDVLGVLADPEKKDILTAYLKGLQEFMNSKREEANLKNAARDMQTACDETVKLVCNDKNLSLKHFFKNNRWEKVGFNDYQVKIFLSFNDYLDKCFKHRADSGADVYDVENIIYLSSMFIRLVLQKYSKSNK